MRGGRYTLTAVAAAVALAMAGGCTAGDDGGTSAAPTTPTAQALDLHATLTQLRIYEGTRRINAQITNRGNSAVRVTSVSLKTPRNAPLPPTVTDTVFQPGQTIDLATRFGDTVCGAPRVADRPVFTLGVADGATIDVPLDRAGVATLSRFDQRDCALKRIAAIAYIRLGSSWSRTKAGGEQFLRGALIVQRPAAAGGTLQDPLGIDELQGSVLVRLLPDRGSLPTTLQPGQPVLRIPVLIGASRCDAHALAGSQQTFLLSVFVSEPDGKEQRVITVPSHRVQVQILALISDVCD